MVQLTVVSAFGEENGVEPGGFEIVGYEIIGNTKLKSAELEGVLEPFTGRAKTAQDVEKARTALEQHYHNRGYPTALVNIPEQSVEAGLVQLQVIESEIRRVRITGNRYFTMQSILKKLPSFRPGGILYLPKIKDELAEINQHPDLKVAPVLIPGKVLGTIDVELKVKDKLPLHGSLELNNRSTHDTTDLRLNALLRYDNLWQKEHSIAFQYQTSPEDTKEVLALALSYVMPALWNSDHILAVYGILSDSEVAFGEGFETVGEGYIVGLRNVIPLSPRGVYTHSLSLGADYKDFDDTLSFEDGSLPTETPLTYLPLSLYYNSAAKHHSGTTRFTIGVNVALRGVVTERNEFEDKRYKSRGNYIYGTLGIERHQTLFEHLQLFVKGDGQLSDQPLPSNEQYVAGGLKSVRGYKETEEVGDNAIHGTVELSIPGFAGLVGAPEWIGISPHIFYDVAGLHIYDPLPGQSKPNTMQGAGGGIRGQITPFFDYEVSWGMALADTENTEKGDHQVYFIAKGKF